MRILPLLTLPVAFAIALAFTPPDPLPALTQGQQGDTALWTAIVERMTAGESYYEASSTELRARHYPTRSIFNWRQPLAYEVTAAIGPRMARALLVAIGIWLIFQSGRIFHWRLLALLAMANSTLMIAAPYAPYLTELWAGAFLALSVLSYAEDRGRTGAAWGLLALFVRELAAPYCVLATVISAQRRRWAELAIWVVGAGLYGVYYAWHAAQALRHISLNDVAHAQSWLCWGGLRFLLQTLRHNGLFLIWPTAVFAMFVTGLAAAAWAPAAPLHLRAAVAGYSVLFLAVGQPFNGYWGFLTAPLMSLWFTHAPAGLRALLGRPQPASESWLERAMHRAQRTGVDVTSE